MLSLVTSLAIWELAARCYPADRLPLRSRITQLLTFTSFCQVFHAVGGARNVLLLNPETLSVLGEIMKNMYFASGLHNTGHESRLYFHLPLFQKRRIVTIDLTLLFINSGTFPPHVRTTPLRYWRYKFVTAFDDPSTTRTCHYCE